MKEKGVPFMHVLFSHLFKSRAMQLSGVDAAASSALVRIFPRAGFIVGLCCSVSGVSYRRFSPSDLVKTSGEFPHA
jgi:hypothetical protein